MTDEERAENYAKGLCKTCTFDTCRHNTLQTCATKESLKQAHLDGLKAGKDMAEADLATIAYMQGAERYKTKWHDLRKNPDDLPKESGYYLVSRYSNYLRIKRYSQTLYFIKGKRNGWNTKMDKTQIIAWCEIPKYEE